jgi:hypothetical protein
MILDPVGAIPNASGEAPDALARLWIDPEWLRIHPARL